MDIITFIRASLYYIIFTFYCFEYGFIMNICWWLGENNKIYKKSVDLFIFSYISLLRLLGVKIYLSGEDNSRTYIVDLQS